MDLMLDIETLSTRVDAAIVSIAVLAFDPNGDPRDLHSTHGSSHNWQEKGWQRNILPELDSHVDPETVRWWFTQPIQVRDQLLGTQRLHGVLPDLAFFLEKAAPDGYERVWANGPAFDVAILDYWCDRLGLPRLFHFRKVRDLRTLRDVAQHPYKKEDKSKNAHVALDDCYTQARIVQECFALLRWQREAQDDRIEQVLTDIDRALDVGGEQSFYRVEDSPKSRLFNPWRRNK